MPAVSKVKSLHKVVDACTQVATLLTDPDDESPYDFKCVTTGGRTGFRFTQKLILNGEEVEITVRGTQLSTITPEVAAVDHLE